MRKVVRDHEVVIDALLRIMVHRLFSEKLHSTSRTCITFFFA